MALALVLVPVLDGVSVFVAVLASVSVLPLLPVLLLVVPVAVFESVPVAVAVLVGAEVVAESSRLTFEFVSLDVSIGERIVI